MAVGAPEGAGCQGTRGPGTGRPPNARDRPPVLPAAFRGFAAGPPGRGALLCWPQGGDPWAGLPAPRPGLFRPRAKLVQGEPGGGPESRAPPLPSP